MASNVSSIFQDKVKSSSSGNLLMDKLEAQQITDTDIRDDDGVIKIPDTIGTNTKEQSSVLNDQSIGGGELSDTNFIEAHPKNKDVHDVSETVGVLNANADVLPNKETEALINKAHEILGVNKEILRAVDPKILKAQIDNYNITEDLNKAPILTNTLKNNPELLTTQSGNISSLSSIETELSTLPGLEKGEKNISYFEGVYNAVDRGVGRLEGGLYSIAAGIKTRLADETDLTIGEAAEKNFYDNAFLQKTARDLGLDPTNKADIDKALEHIKNISPQAYSSILQAAGTSSLFETIPRALLNTWFGELIFGTQADAPPELQSEQL